MDKAINWLVTSIYKSRTCFLVNAPTEAEAKEQVKNHVYPRAMYFNHELIATPVRSIKVLENYASEHDKIEVVKWQS